MLPSPSPHGYTLQTRRRCDHRCSLYAKAFLPEMAAIRNDGVEGQLQNAVELIVEYHTLALHPSRDLVLSAHPQFVLFLFAKHTLFLFHFRCYLKNGSIDRHVR